MTKETIALQANTRTEIGKKVRKLRAQSLVPGVVYGHETKNYMVSVAAVPFDKVLSKAGESSLVDLHIDGGAPLKVLIHEVQRDALTNQPSHVDFFQVSMTEKLTVPVAVVFVGESKAVKELGGTLIKTLDHITIECLPQDLLHEVEIDLSKLEAFDDTIHASDIILPQTVTLKTDPHEVLVTVKAPKTEAEIAADLATPASEPVAEVVVEKKGKKEEEGEPAVEEKK